MLPFKLYNWLCSVPYPMLIINRHHFCGVAGLFFVLQLFKSRWCLKNGCKRNQWRIDHFHFKLGQIHIANVNEEKLTMDIESLNVTLFIKSNLTMGCGANVLFSTLWIKELIISLANCSSLLIDNANNNSRKSIDV